VCVCVAVRVVVCVRCVDVVRALLCTLVDVFIVVGVLLCVGMGKRGKRAES